MKVSDKIKIIFWYISKEEDFADSQHFQPLYKTAINVHLQSGVLQKLGRLHSIQQDMDFYQLYKSKIPIFMTGQR